MFSEYKTIEELLKKFSDVGQPDEPEYQDPGPMAITTKEMKRLPETTPKKKFKL